jgi:hypothetical protein
MLAAETVEVRKNLLKPFLWQSGDRRLRKFLKLMRL